MLKRERLQVQPGIGVVLSSQTMEPSPGNSHFLYSLAHDVRRRNPRWANSMDRTLKESEVSKGT